MDDRSNPGKDRQEKKPQSEPPVERRNPGQQDRRHRDDPATQGEDNESLPEGTNQPREKNPTQRRAEEKLDHQRDEPGATQNRKRRETSPSDLFNGA